jgi:hypothetical protein
MKKKRRARIFLSIPIPRDIWTKHWKCETEWPNSADFINNDKAFVKLTFTPKPDL